PHFYFVVGVTAEVTLSGTFNDYGGQGVVSYSGNYEAPLYNLWQPGPDLLQPSPSRWWPFVYSWKPADGNVVHFPFYQTFMAPGWGIPNGTGNFFIYYAQLTSQTNYQPPLTRNRLTYESELGNGTEYADAGLSSQRIIYPFYAGAGSSDVDLGASGMLPQFRLEVKGSHALYSTGDA